MRKVCRFLAPALAAGLALSAPAFAPPAASAPCTSPLTIPVGFTFEPWHPCPTQDLKLWVVGCRECVTLQSFERTDSGRVVVHCTAPEACPTILTCTPESLAVNLGRFALGNYNVVVEIQAKILLSGGDTCSVTEERTIGFTVGTDCPPEGNLPYVESIQIGPAPPDSTCPWAPIPVTLSGHLTKDCLYIKDVIVHTFRVNSIPNATVTVVVGRDVCQIRQCIEYPIPWRAAVEIPGMAPGSYVLSVRVEQVAVACDGSTTPDGFWSAAAPYSVVDSCPPPPPPYPCFSTFWDHAGQGGCDAYVGPDHPADVTLLLSTNVALAGLQGRLVVQPAGLKITGLLPVGPAAGMRISWQPTSDGARFVMFAEKGAPIPPAPDDTRAAPVPVLQVTASAVAGSSIPSVTLVHAVDLLGSDELGVSVPRCPEITRNIAIADAARICAASPCDYNADNVTDVRDLVLMAHCVLQSGYCPPGASEHLDCDHNGQVGIDDVLCCARVFLRGPEPPNVPGRPEPGIRVSIREPVVGATAVDLPVRLEGADRIGAARLAIRYPSDRFEVSAVDLPGGASNWLCLHEGSGDRLTLGLICLGSGTQGPLDLTLRLALKAGQTPGGDVRVDGAEFAGPDGAALEVGLGAPAWSFDGPPGLALSPGVPNPFSRESRIDVTLARPAPVEISVHDLGGRQIALLHRGALEAGSHPFVWKGTRADGSVAPTGVYIVRARAGSEVRARKLVLLRGN